MHLSTTKEDIKVLHTAHNVLQTRSCNDGECITIVQEHEFEIQLGIIKANMETRITDLKKPVLK